MILAPEERKQIENEMLFRRINEKAGSDLDELDSMHISEGNPHLVRDDELLMYFKCECSDEKCQVRIPMKLSRYKKLHVNRSSFIIKPHHEINPIEKVVETNDTYSVVKKNNVTSEPDSDAEFNVTGLNNSPN